MKPDLRICFACLFGFVLPISASNVLGGPRMTYSLLAMDQEKIRRVETRLSMATVEKGQRSGIREALQTVIRNRDEWNAFWKRHASTNTPPALAPIVDFDREMVVGIFLGEKSTGGYEVEIVRAERRDSCALFLLSGRKSTSERNGHTGINPTFSSREDYERPKTTKPTNHFQEGLMIKRISFVMVSIFVLLALDVRPGSQYAAQPQSQAPDYVPDEIIVKFREGAGEYQKDLARFRVSGTRKKIFKIIRGLEVVKLSRGVSVKEAIDLYRQDPDVLYAEPNYILRTTLTPNDPRFGEMWGLNNIGQSSGTPDADIDAPEAWNHTTGSSDVIVAVIDSGVDYDHPDLSANMFRNTADCNNNGIDDDGNGYVDDCYGIDTRNNDSDPMDDNNHGTHVAGTIGAVGNNNRGVVGINWNVQVMACKFVNASGSGTTDESKWMGRGLRCHSVRRMERRATVSSKCFVTSPICLAMRRYRSNGLSNRPRMRRANNEFSNAN